MPTMTKRVNIRTTMPVRNVTPPISGTLHDVIMTTGDILKCLSKRAVVDEILPDGRTVRLTMRNYYTDNGAGLYASKKPVVTARKEEKKAEEKKPELEIAHQTVEETVTPAVDDEPKEEAPEVPAEAENAEAEVPVVETTEAEPIVESADNAEVQSVDDSADAAAKSLPDEQPESAIEHKNTSSKKRNNSRKK